MSNFGSWRSFVGAVEDCAANEVEFSCPPVLPGLPGLPGGLR